MLLFSSLLSSALINMFALTAETNQWMTLWKANLEETVSNVRMLAIQDKIFWRRKYSNIRKTNSNQSRDWQTLTWTSTAQFIYINYWLMYVRVRRNPNTRFCSSDSAIWWTSHSGSSQLPFWFEPVNCAGVLGNYSK